MKYYYIYSAGGGAGDWNGVKRVWNTKMPKRLKNNVLLKFGDVYFNHASVTNLIKRSYWDNILDMRKWLFNATNDLYILDKTNILLDSGTSKIVSFVATKNPNLKPDELLTEFDSFIKKEHVLEKYAQVIIESKINEAVSFDAPNPFKLRTQSNNTITNIFGANEFERMITLTSQYANTLYHLLGEDDDKIMTTINGLWDTVYIKKFLLLLEYKPKKFAIGGLTKTKKSDLIKIIENLNSVLDFKKLKRVHFLGCGGVEKTKIIKNYINGENFSVDCSTPMNRSIDGNKNGTSFSGYFNYNDSKMIRIKPTNLTKILKIHKNYNDSIYSEIEMKEILDKILKHQSGHTSNLTYDARAQLSFHNHDVFRFKAE